MLDKSFRTSCHRLRVQLPAVQPVNYVWLMQQTNLQVLMSSVASTAAAVISWLMYCLLCVRDSSVTFLLRAGWLIVLIEFSSETERSHL